MPVQQNKSQFDKVFSSWDILVIAFGAMIGWGWVVQSGDWIEKAGVIGAMLGFLIGGVMIFFIGLTYAELTPAMPECGGEHVFSMRAMGPYGSFICTWAIILGYVSVVCFEACAFPTIISYLWPGFLKGYMYTIAGFKVYASWVAVAVVFAFLITIINLMGAKTAAILQTILTVAIGAAGILLVVASFITGSPSNLDGQVFNGSTNGTIIGNIIRVAAVSPFFFVGFDVIPQAAEEINIPLKKIGKVLLLSIVLAITFYALVIFAVGYVMDAKSIVNSYSASGLVTADAMAKAFHSEAMAKVIIIAGMCGIVTSWNSFMLGGSRAIYSMAESYMIPAAFKKLSPKHKTPTTAIWLIGILSMLAPFFGRQMLVWVSDAGNFGCVLAYFMVAMSFLILRKKEPNMARPYKVSHGMLCGTIAVITSGIMLFLYILPNSGAALAPQEWAIAGGWYVLGIFFIIGCKAVYKDKFGYYAPLNAMINGKPVEGAAPAGKAAASAVWSIEKSLGREEAAADDIPAMSSDFSYFLPVNIHFGAGKVSEVGTLASAYGKKAMIVTGGSSSKKSGLLYKINGLLDQAGMSTEIFDKVTPNPLTTTAMEGAAKAKDDSVEVIVAVGGGSVLDCAKAIAFMAKNDGDISDYIFGRKSSAAALPLVLIPTTCGTGSEANGFAVLTDPATGDKKSLRTPAIVAKDSIVDPDVMKTMPKSVLASVGFDALCHCMEAFTARNAQPVTDALCLYAIPLIAENLVRLYKGDDSDEAWAAITLGATFGGMVINTAGVTLAHGMEHPVSGKVNATHGKGLAALTPVVIESEFSHNRLKFGRIARMLGGFTAEDCAGEVRNLLSDIDLNITLTDLGIKKEDIPWLTENCLKVSAGNIKNTPGSYTKEDISRLYEAAL
ncbi:MAG: iron-containing alcohol dehydrogenase [bacterium LCO1.1]|uniref:Iron-containing alcohol dehydrogenase n=1 Tax=Candidatus Weimeria bifida TaxID=2599074 RepID=A0A6N7J058_9FIRM|nr:iron-containing alcohol dehydrogenase [Candidatus Weimeria bifida]